MNINWGNLPQHIAIIMDGNGRWAKKHAIGRIRGHKKGAQAVRTTVTVCREIGIRYLTLFALSTENWGRPAEEISALMSLLEEYLTREANKLQKEGIKLTTIGDIDKLYSPVKKKLLEVIEATAKNNKMILNLALSYGSRDEIIIAVKNIIQDKIEGKVDLNDINKNNFSRYLYTNDIPDPDLLIRTSGEYRLSNFLLWQLAYTELYFTNVLWPDFNKDELLKAIANYQKRERRYGLVSEQLEKNNSSIRHFSQD
jgi:undecaprenyl diphosphate synthase